MRMSGMWPESFIKSPGGVFEIFYRVLLTILMCQIFRMTFPELQSSGGLIRLSFTEIRMKVWILLSKPEEPAVRKHHMRLK